MMLPALAFLLFAILVVWHARIEERVAWHEAHGLVNGRAMARIAPGVAGAARADPPPGVDAVSHPYALDLDVFGRASLFQCLGPAATPRGTVTLATWLLHPAPRPEIVERQGAIAQLAEFDAWRGDLSAHGVLVGTARGRTEIAAFIEWAEGDDAFGRCSGLVKAVVVVITLTLWTLIALSALGVVAAPLWSLPLVIGIDPVVLRWRTRSARPGSCRRRPGCVEPVRGDLPACRGRAFGRRAGWPECVEPAHGRRRAGPRLHAAVSIGSSASASSGAARRSLHFPDPGADAVGLPRHVRARPLAATERAARPRLARRARRARCARAARHGAARQSRLGRAGDRATGTRSRPKAIGHPLIPDDRRVANDVTIGPPGTLVLITGSNMSGKSTLLRAIGLNIVLAQAGALRLRAPHEPAASAICRRACACRTRSSAACRTSWRRWRG